MKKKTQLILEDFITGNDKPLKEFLQSLEKPKNIYEETLKDDFYFHWNKEFLNASLDKKISLTAYPDYIPKIPLIWISKKIETIEKIMEKYDDIILNLPKEVIKKEVQRTKKLFQFLNIDENMINIYIQNKIQLLPTRYDYSLTNSNKVHFTRCIFFLSKILYLKDNNYLKKDIGEVLNALYNTFKEKNKDVFSIHIYQDAEIDKKIAQKKDFFTPKNETSLYFFDILSQYKEEFIEAMNNLGGISSKKYEEIMKNEFNDLVISYNHTKLNESLESKQNTFKKLKV